MSDEEEGRTKLIRLVVRETIREVVKMVDVATQFCTRDGKLREGYVAFISTNDSEGDLFFEDVGCFKYKGQALNWLKYMGKNSECYVIGYDKDAKLVWEQVKA
jgi:hypothetical protein